MSLWRRKHYITIDSAALEELSREREREETGEYDEIQGKFIFAKGTTPDTSRKTEGALRATTRDNQGRLVGQAEFIPSDDDAEMWGGHSVDSCGLDASPPVVSDSVSWPLAVGWLGLGVLGAWMDSRRENERAREEGEPAENEEVQAVADLLPPAGWYSVSGDVHELRFWDGSAWTDQFARVTDAVSAVPADWYPDPASPASHLRFWDGAAWTNHVQAASINADWYPDPSDAFCLRWWDGATWTHHVRPRMST